MAHHRKSHRKHSGKRNGSRKTLVKKSFDNSVQLVKSTSRKYMPKVKTGLENVGDKVITTGQQSVPFLQRMTRKVFSMFGLKSKGKGGNKSRRNR
jgi:hypothetical protein